MSGIVSIINFAVVGLFGSFLSASFCDIVWSRKNKYIFSVGILLIALFQLLLFFSFDIQFLRGIYPLTMHLPLAVILWVMCRKKLWSVTSVLIAYMCCQIRRWLALVIANLLNGDAFIQEIAEIGISIPLFILIIYFISNAVKSLSHHTILLQAQFTLIPFVGYLFDYLTRVYTDSLIVGKPIATEFMFFVCAVTQLVFAKFSDNVMKKRLENEHIKLALDLQIKQANIQIEEMKKSQMLAGEYRHNLRHHLQYVNACIENGNIKQATEYIKNLDAEIRIQALTVYCENTEVNLILSSFSARAKEKGIPMTVHVQIGESKRIADSDLCVLLSNALENALNACIIQINNQHSAFIEVKGYQKNDKMFFEISNSCSGNVKFKDDIPITYDKGHGIGIQSICSIVDKYGGIYSFEVKSDVFICRLSL